MKSTIFLDMDDTIFRTCVLYERAIDRAARLCEARGLATYAEAVALIQKIDYERATTLGFAASRFPTTLAEVYREFCGRLGYATLPEVALRFEQIGYDVYDEVPELFEDTLESLARLQALDAKVVLVTKGDPDVQNARIEQTGIRGYFDEIRIVPSKTVMTYLDILNDLDVWAHDVWMVGDSIKSDINPALAAGIEGVHVKYDIAGWAFELENPTGPYHFARSLAEAIDIIEQA